MVVLDTNIIIDHLRQGGRAKTLLMKVAEKIAVGNLAISVLSVQELYEGRSSKNEQKEHFLLATITPLRILPYTFEIAQLAGEMARDTDRPIEFADAGIAATAVVNGAGFLTLNRKDFKHFAELELVSAEAL